MHRNDLLQKLEAYLPENPKEVQFKEDFFLFIKTYGDCFERSLAIGHITGSAWVVNKDRSRALLTHHKKLDRWLQLGGHADGDPNVLNVASREAQEESGLKSLKLISSAIFDIDIHTIPARKDEPEHLHYDVRFLFKADDNEQLHVSSESKNLHWISLDHLDSYIDHNESIQRMAGKA
ncbi:NUDIX hydrolase [Fulvivirga sp. M361]|uniref:NUDIX hydrolase n=1 Tax=Fulvivirga sp. M361 TaxID=2594266 RepID=UPI00117BDD33|nr:NUDIX hydrolase [Fulvivirga sp. M361]TRX56082.1 NUDIX hydrolase [Fulvivirga sp. M361]